MSQTTLRVRNAGRKGGKVVVGGLKKLIYITVAVTVLVCLLVNGLIYALARHV